MVLLLNYSTILLMSISMLIVHITGCKKARRP
jgi:hypothetical protein